jgi:hypothetical protein
MQPMTAPADLLWRINNEYQKRLKQAKTFLGLLEQLVRMQGDDGQTLTTLRHALEQIDHLADEHRDWRYQYYYESLDTRRMVQSNRAIEQALAHFSRMHTRHERQLQALRSLLVQLQRPDPTLTRVPGGDLWVMTEFAIADLSGFDDYMRALAVTS